MQVGDLAIEIGLVVPPRHPIYSWRLLPLKREERRPEHRQARVGRDGRRSGEGPIQESFEAAKSFAYAQPVGPGSAAVQLTRDYETNARNVARTRAALAAARLARVLDTAQRIWMLPTMPQKLYAASDLLNGFNSFDELGFTLTRDFEVCL